MSLGHWPGESDDYRKLRDEIQSAEVELRDARERVAALRRRLPLDTVVEDASFERIRAGAREAVRLSELFERPELPLVLMHFMFGKAQSRPCPMCTLWADGYDGIVAHLQQRVNFGVLVAGDVGAFEGYARSRGWRRIPALGAGESDLKRRLGFEDEEGNQSPGVSVFARRADGSVVHAYSQSADLGPDGFRGMDLLSPFWHFLDLTPEGRGEFFPSLDYSGAGQRSG